MSRIQTTFSRLASEQRAALIPFVTAGFPSPALTVPLMHAMVAAGVDVIELGVPFSDPMADGPSIQRASEKALAQGKCPFHDDHEASMSVNVVSPKGGWLCFAGCGKGDLVAFHMRATGLPFPDAVADLLGVRK